MIAYVTWFPPGQEEQTREIEVEGVPTVGDSFSLGDDDLPMMWVHRVCWAPDADRKRWHPEITLGSPSR